MHDVSHKRHKIGPGGVNLMYISIMAHEGTAIAVLKIDQKFLLTICSKL